MASTRPTLNIELKEIKPEAVIIGFKEMRAVPILDLLEGFLKGNTKETQQFVTRISPEVWGDGTVCIQKVDRKILSTWLVEYFKGIPNHRVADASNVAKYSARELVILGYIFIHGLGVDKNLKKAYHYFNHAADKNDVVGLFELGKCLIYGFAVTKDWEKATKMFEKAHYLGFAPATTAFGELPEEHKTELNYYLEASSKDDPRAWCNLGWWDWRKNHKVAASCFARAALLGSVVGMYEYADLKPIDEKWKYIRLAELHGYEIPGHDSLIFDNFNFVKEVSYYTPSMIYHAIWLKEFILPNELFKLKKLFFDLCETRPKEVKLLALELDDREDDFPLILDDQEREMLALLALFREDTHFLIQPLFNIVLGYLNLPTFFVPYILEKEKLSRETAKSIFSTNPSSFFSKIIAQADIGEISYQTAMRKAFM